MNLIFCIDEKGGMLFHARRVTSDRIVTERILDICKRDLWIAPYSRSLFPDGLGLRVSENFLEQAGESEWCFVEAVDPAKYIGCAEHIVIFHWNRTYPSELKFSKENLKLGWELNHTEEFPGYSHQRITMEVYHRC